MNAPLIWIVLPAALGLGLTAAANRRPRLTNTICLATTAILALLAAFFPADETIRVRSVTITLDSSLAILGRYLWIDIGLLRILAVLYGGAFIWFAFAQISSPGNFFAPLGMIAIALLAGSISVLPWNFAGIFFLMAVFVLVPVLSPPGTSPPNGVMTFLSFQIFGAMILLIAGASIEGLEPTPPGLEIVERPAIFLGLGAAFVLGLFPFHAWKIRLVEEIHPAAAGFVLVFLPSAAVLLLLQVVDRHVWLRNAEEAFTLFRWIGMLAVVVGGFFAAFQRNLSRVMGFTALVETGSLFLAIGSGPRTAVALMFPLLIARGLAFLPWSIGLSEIKNRMQSLDFDHVRGFARGNPVFVVAILLGSFSSAGLPLVAGFLPRLRILSTLAPSHPTAAVALWLGSIGLFVASVRSLAALAAPAETPQAESAPAPADSASALIVLANLRYLLLAGLCLLVVLSGLLPGWIEKAAAVLPLAFDHLRP